MFKVFILNCFYFFQWVHAEEPILVNEILFAVKGQTLTRLDFKKFSQYKDCLSRFDKLDQIIIEQFKNESELFIFFQLSALEAEQLEVVFSKDDLTALFKLCKIDIDTKKSADQSEQVEQIKLDLSRMLRASELMHIKLRQFKNRPSTLAWMQILKRKFSFEWKTNEFKSNTSLGF